MWDESCSYTGGTICARFFQFPTQTSPITERLVCAPKKAFICYVMTTRHATAGTQLATLDGDNVQMFRTHPEITVCPVL